MKKQTFVIEYANGETPAIVAENIDYALLLARADGLHANGKNKILTITDEKDVVYQVINNTEHKKL